MGISINKTALKSPNGILKIVALVSSVELNIKHKLRCNTINNIVSIFVAAILVTFHFCNFTGTYNCRTSTGSSWR